MSTDDDKRAMLRDIMRSPLPDDVSMLSGMIQCHRSGDKDVLNMLSRELLFCSSEEPGEGAGWLQRRKWKRYVRRQGSNREALLLLALLLDTTRALAALAEERGLTQEVVSYYLAVLAAENQAKP